MDARSLGPPLDPGAHDTDGGDAQHRRVRTRGDDMGDKGPGSKSKDKKSKKKGAKSEDKKQ